MTSADLEAIKARDQAPTSASDGVLAVVDRRWLLGEVDRLRALILDAESDGGEAYAARPCCPWCNEPSTGEHWDECKAFAAKGVLR